MAISKRFILHAAISAIAVAAAQPVFAQASPETGAATDSGLGEIIVTARRTSENLQTVPVAVSVLSSDTIERQRIRGARDLQFNAPSLVVSSDPLGGSTAPIFQLRGQQPALSSDDTVVTYFGDLPINARAFAGGLFDLESVQILRGPQGTLFGKNSTGGAVIFTPKKANTETLSGFADATIGNYSYRQLSAGVNVPVVEGVLGVRVSGQITRQDGFVRNLGGPDGADKHNEVLRASMVFTPTAELRNEMQFNYFHGRQHQNPAFTEVIALPAAGIPPFVAQVNEQMALGKRTINYSFGKNNDDNDVYIFSNMTSYDFGSVKLKNIFGYVDQKPRLRYSQTSTNFPIVDVTQNRHIRQISDELQLSGSTSSLNWIVGGFYSREKLTGDQAAFVFGSFANTTRPRDLYTSKALFAQATYNLSGMGIEGLKFTAGVRHTWDDRDGGLVTTTFVANVPSAVSTVANSVKYKNFSWTLGLDYQVAPDILLYVASRHSYKAGGFNLVSNNPPPALQKFNPEKLTDVEIGAKTTVRFGDTAVRANLALYRGWYKKMQYQELALCNGTVNSYVINSGDGSPKGLEFEVNAAVKRNLRIGGFYNRTLGSFKSFQLVQPSVCTAIGFGLNLKGADFGNISKDTYGLNAAYSIPLSGNGEEIELSADYYHRSRRVGNATAGVNSQVPGYGLANARIDYNNIGGSNISVGAWVRNIGNKLYVAYRQDVLGLTGYRNAQYGDPRTFGADVKVRF